MSRIISRSSAVALLAVAGLLAGCGDDKKEGANAGSTPAAAATTDTAATTAAVATTPEGSWASKLCTEMASRAKELQPPSIEGASPEATKKALIAFFVSVGDQLGDQIDAIEEIGPPPGDDAAGWKAAVKRMKKTEDGVGDIRKSLRAASPKSSADINKIIADLSGQMQTLTKYQGPVADLSKDKALAAALSAEPACAKVS